MASRLLVVLIVALAAMFALQGAKWFRDDVALEACLKNHSRGVCYSSLYP